MLFSCHNRENELAYCFLRSQNALTGFSEPPQYMCNPFKQLTFPVAKLGDTPRIKSTHDAIYGGKRAQMFSRSRNAVS
jgi:hypothetical protein